MAKSQKVIFAHSLVNSMGAIGDRALAPMFLHPLQYGGRNLGKAYWFGTLFTFSKALFHATYIQMYATALKTVFSKSV
jgi:hypothetical protein